LNEVFERMLSVMKNEGLSQVQMAKILGISNASVSHLISGRNNPGLDVIRNFSKHYSDLDLNWLLMGTGTKVPEDSSEKKISLAGEAGVSENESADPTKVILVYKDDRFVILNPKK
jgi:transcriptional regulator with XRE-family HTH domain